MVSCELYHNELALSLNTKVLAKRTVGALVCVRFINHLQKTKPVRSANQRLETSKNTDTSFQIHPKLKQNLTVNRFILV